MAAILQLTTYTPLYSGHLWYWTIGHVMVNWHLLKQGIHWQEPIKGSLYLPYLALESTLARVDPLIERLPGEVSHAFSSKSQSKQSYGSHCFYTHTIWRTNSSKNLFEENIRDFKSRLRVRGYPDLLVNRDLQIWVRVRDRDRVRVLISNFKPVTSPEPSLFFVTYQQIRRL